MIKSENICGKIKPLDWKPLIDSEYELRLVATPSFGLYQINYIKTTGECNWGYIFDDYFDEKNFHCNSIEEGKQLAWENWLSRILPSLIIED